MQTTPVIPPQVMRIYLWTSTRQCVIKANVTGSIELRQITCSLSGVFMEKCPIYKVNYNTIRFLELLNNFTAACGF